MSLIQYLKYSSCAIVICSLLFSEYIAPDNDVDTKEYLTIYKKDREYSRLIEEKLVYFIEGPVILNIYSRRAFPEDTKKDKSYEFEIIIDETKTLLAKHDYREDPNVYNKIRPGRAYTLAGKDVVNIPSGKHRVELIPSDRKNKILIRATTNLFKGKNKISEIYPIDYRYINSAILKNQKFWILSNKIDNEVNRISFKVTGDKNKSSFIRIVSRTTFGNDKYDKGEDFTDINQNGEWDEEEPYIDYPNNSEYYQFKIRKDDQLISTHHMFAEKSEGAKIINNSSLQISKWRTTLIDAPSGEHEYEIELVSPEDKHVLFKIQEDKK